MTTTEAKRFALLALALGFGLGMGFIITLANMLNWW